MHSNDETQKDSNENTEDPKDLRKANENIRKGQGDDATGPIESKKSGNKPALDRDR